MLFLASTTDYESSGAVKEREREKVSVRGGREEGRKERRKEGRREGRKEGRKKGRKVKNIKYIFRLYCIIIIFNPKINQCKNIYLYLYIIIYSIEFI